MLRSAFRWLVCSSLLLLGTYAAATAESLPSDKSLTADMLAEFGAATWIPEDAGYFGASYRYQERWQAFTQTKAYQEILTMPVVQMGWGWLQQQPYLGQLAMMRAQNRLLDDGLDVLQDAFSQESFVYVDARGPGFINELGRLYNSMMFNGFLQGINESSDALPAYTEEQNRLRIIRDLLAVQNDLRLPGVVFGFRLSDPQAGRDWLASLTPVLHQNVPFPLQEESLGGGDYLTLSLNAAMFLTPDVLARMETEFELADIDAETVEQFVQFVQSQTLSISLGMRGDYLLLSLGADNTHLKKLGTGVSLAECEALAPVRRHFLSRLIGLSYVHPELTRYGKMEIEGLVAKLQDLLHQAEDSLPAGLAERVVADATRLLHEINESLPVAKPIVAASFWQHGIETFTFSTLVPGTLDSSEPLSILSHAGQSPLLALAAHSQPTLPHYNKFVSWLQTFYGYFKDYAVPEIPAEGLADFRQFESLALPALQKFHETTRDFLLPSLEGGQSLFVMDAGGALTKSPDTKELLAQPIRFPRLAMVVEVNDTKRFLAAWQQYREILNSLLAEVAKVKADTLEIQLPAPLQRSLGSATLFTYPIAAEYNPAFYLNDDFEPHALVTPEHLVLSFSTQHSQQLLEDHPLPSSAHFDLQQPAGRATWFDFLVLKDLICEDAKAILTLVEDEKDLDPNLSLLISIHIDKLRRVLGAVHNYRSRTYEEQGQSVKHSWFKLQDIEP